MQHISSQISPTVARLPPRAAAKASRRTLAVICNASSSSSSSNPIGVHALVWTGGWSEPECRKAVRGTKEAGYDLIEVPLLEPETVDAAMTKRVLQEYGIRASASLGLRRDADISSDDAEVVAAGKQLLVQALEAVAGMGGFYMCGPIYSAIAKYPGPCTQQGYKNAVQALKELSDRASDLNVGLGLEVINRYETNVLNTAQQGMAMLGDIGRSNVTIHLDTYHMNIEENSMHQAVTTCGDKLGYMHIGESHRGYLGTGSVDFQGVFEAMAAIGYQGPITFESFSSAVVSPSLSNELCVWRNLWDSSDDLAQHARGFIDAQWHAARQVHSPPGSG